MMPVVWEPDSILELLAVGLQKTYYLAAPDLVADWQKTCYLAAPDLVADWQKTCYLAALDLAPDWVEMAQACLIMSLLVRQD